MARSTIRQKMAQAALPAMVLAAVAVGVSMSAPAKASVTMRGSPASMERQYAVAVSEDFTFAETPAAVADLVSKERLVRLPGGADYTLAKVSYPYTRPEVKAFVEDVSAEYRKGCGEQLVVTSLTRPRAEQPGNAHKLSVHPAGMAVDFRISRNSKCQKWFEKALLAFEEKAVLDATRERNPPHYHVAVFPDAYRAFAARNKPAEERPSASPTVLRPKRMPEQPSAPAAPRVGEASRPTAAQPEAAKPSTVLVLISSIALLFLVGWRIAKHHGPG
ncbi:DUF5715 family protein [Longimicrobium sp.]|uniref:DUF5715 family protein n=1 Tax=Longimicrobium sp. TaxID=2029185 RepID=UPI003B3A4A57